MYMRGLRDITDLFTSFDSSSVDTSGFDSGVPLPEPDVSLPDTADLTPQIDYSQVASTLPTAGIDFNSLLQQGLSLYGTVTAIKSGATVLPTGQIVRAGTTYPPPGYTLPRSSPFLGSGAAGSSTLLLLGAAALAAIVLLKR